MTLRGEWVSVCVYVCACACAVLLGGCVDFGAEVEQDPEVDFEPDVGGGGGGDMDTGGNGADGDEGCVEGEVPPSDDGPQIRFATLNVDKPILVIAAGDTVTWTNGDSEKHDATAGAPGAEQPPERGGFGGPEMPPGGKWAYRFCNPRTIVWFCAVHAEQMNGYRIIIE